MPWTRDGKQLWSYINKFKPHILSAFSPEDPNCKPGKMRWLRKDRIHAKFYDKHCEA